jgi:hypothetical protein
MLCERGVREAKRGFQTVVIGLRMLQVLCTCEVLWWLLVWSCVAACGGAGSSTQLSLSARQTCRYYQHVPWGFADNHVP